MLPGGVTVRDGAVLVRFREGALLVEGGSSATVDWPRHLALPSWVLESWAVGIAMAQRGNLSLHASVVAVDGRAVCLAGASGAGKSTTSLALSARGHRLLTDDVAIVRTDSTGSWVLPYHRHVHLTDSATAALGVESDVLSPLPSSPGKLSYRPEPPPTDPQRIHALVLLARGDVTPSPRVRRLRGTEGFSATMVHAGRPLTSPAIMGESRYFRALADLARHTPVYLIQRPPSGWTVARVCELVEELTAAG